LIRLETCGYRKVATEPPGMDMRRSRRGSGRR
jgi:hypothetical protein